VATTNETLFDAAVSHQIDLQRYSNGEVKKLLRILNKVDSDLVVKLQLALERLPRESFTVERLEALLGSVREVNASAYIQLRNELSGDLRELVDYEAGYQRSLFENTIQANVAIASVLPEQVYAAAMARPFQGRILTEWAASLEATRLQRIKDAVAVGYIENETIQQITQRIRGTRSLNYADGLLEIDRRHAEAVIRTAINHTAFYTRSRFYEDNAELIKGLRWTATLDSRTSEICRARDGNIYPMKSGPRPPAHWNCRSTMTPVLKSWKELGLDELPAGTRASLDGQEPADMTYQQWLRKQSVARQEEILGVSKAKLFRDGGLELDRFVDRKGHVFTLAELRERDAAAFKKAGL